MFLKIFIISDTYTLILILRLRPALPAGGVYHYRVKAVNILGQASIYSNFFRENKVQTGVIAHPVAIYQNSPKWFVNASTCFDVLLDQPRCPSIIAAISSFEELIDVRYGLTPDVYYWPDPIVFQREGASVEKLVSLFPGSTATKVIVDCMGHRCFQECKEPIYLPTMLRRCFGPSKLSGITFRNATCLDGHGAVLSRWENVKFSQRRKMIITDCVFEHNRAWGNGGALFFHGISQQGGITILNTVFRHNVAIAGSGGGLTFDSCHGTLNNVSFFNNSALMYLQCYGGTCNDLKSVRALPLQHLNNSTRNSSALHSRALGLIETNPFGNGGAFAIISTTAGSVVTAKLLMIISNFAEESGGGFFSQGSSLVAEAVEDREVSMVFRDNRATLGGNMYVSKSAFNTTAAPTLSYNNKSVHQYIVTQGQAIKDGGGIACVGSTLHLEGTSIDYNSAGLSGGGIFGVLCLLETVSSVIANNMAEYDGGGVYLESLSAASLLSSQITSNYARGAGGGIYSRYSDTFQLGASLLDKNDAAQGGGLYIEDCWQVPLVADSRIVYNNARDGGGGGIMWERTPPTMLQNVVIDFNTAQYGAQMASGIAKLVTNLANDIMTKNTDPLFPEISVKIIDHYGSVVRRRNQATTVVVTVFSVYCMYRNSDNCIIMDDDPVGTSIPTCHNCITAAQSVSGKPAQEIPGMEGMVNFTGLGVRAWPGNHTIRLEIDRIAPIFRLVQVADCEAGQFLEIKQGVDGGTCARCPSGFHKELEGIQACKSCSAGFACLAGATVPVPCTSGRYSVKESPFCTDCSLGQYQPAPMQGGCIGCLAGTFANETALIGCHDCQHGKAAESDYAVECILCNLGRFSDVPRSTSCKDCPRGYASGGNRTMGQSCLACDAGFYSAIPGSQACTRCSTGKRTAFPAMWTCGPCPEGTASGDESSTTCQICAQGQFAEGQGNDECSVCPSGWHASAQQNDRCTVCYAGTACPRGSDQPEICAAGWFSPQDESKECFPCAIGTASTKPKSDTCEICAAGRFASFINSTECTLCPIGMYISEKRSSLCRVCVRGWSAPMLGSPMCTECPEKWRSSNRIDPGERSELCIPCYLGEVQPPESGECHYCAPTTFSLEAGERFTVSEYLTPLDNPDIGKVFPIGAQKWAKCHQCPLGATCRGGHRIKALNGYWRSSNMSTSLTECFHPVACEGARRELDKRPELLIERNESCATGFTGRLCHACSAGWGRENFDSCQECPPRVANMALTIGGGLFVIGILTSFIIYSIKSSSDERSVSSMMFKTLAAYGQVIGIGE